MTSWFGSEKHTLSYREQHTAIPLVQRGPLVFLAILKTKAERAGQEVMAVDPRNTPRRCPECGHTAKENRPTQEEFHCVPCSHTAHADTVGAVNVLRAGLARRDADPA
jgi:putative transposase